MQKSWHAPELTLVQKFCSLQSLSSITLPTNIPMELQQSFMKLRHEKTAFPDTTIDSITAVHYELNMLCFPNQICAKMLAIHCPLPPGREK